VPQSNLSYSKFILFTTWSEEKDTTTTTASAQDPSIQQKHINNIVEEHQDIPTAPTGFLRTTHSNQVMINTFMLFMMHIHQKIPPILRKIMQPYWLNISNSSNNRSITTFNKISKETSSERQVAHQSSYSAKSFMGT
jgi:hypothetical protein